MDDLSLTSGIEQAFLHYKALCKLAKHATIELQSQPLVFDIWSDCVGQVGLQGEILDSRCILPSLARGISLRVGKDGGWLWDSTAFAFHLSLSRCPFVCRL